MFYAGRLSFCEIIVEVSSSSTLCLIDDSSGADGCINISKVQSCSANDLIEFRDVYEIAIFKHICLLV